MVFLVSTQNVAKFACYPQVSTIPALPGGASATSWAYQQKSNLSKLRARRQYQGYEASARGFPLGGVHKWGYPNSWMVYMENPTKMDDN